jgi:hypothetical protein
MGSICEALRPFAYVPTLYIAAARSPPRSDPQTWLADVLSCIAGYPAHRLDELAPWNWKQQAPANSSQAA